MHMRPHPRGSSGLEMPSSPRGGLGEGSRSAAAAPKVCSTAGGYSISIAPNILRIRALFA
eukprot:3127811-Karenia_brevis.AAC.1